MNSIRYTPWFSALKAFQYILAGRLHFPEKQIGAMFVDEKGQKFRVFRHAVIDTKQRPRNAKAVFIAHFHVAGMTVRKNILFSLAAIPFFIGLPGLLSKQWMLDEATGDFAGYYEWETVEDAEHYATSFAVKFMMARSVPETVWFRVYPVETAPAPPSPVTI